MPQAIFGDGALFATPQGANPTPIKVGALQDVSVDISFDIKQLFGGNQFALEQARGKGKIDLKATSGHFDGVKLNGLFFGGTTSTGETLSSIDEAGTGASVPVANAGTWTRDLGVYDSTSKLYKTRVASAPAAGQYSVAAGTYTFNAADSAHAFRISYEYSSSSTGVKSTFTNPLMGSNIVFALDLVNKYQGNDGAVRSLMLHFYAVQCPKLSLPFKMDEFTLAQLTMSAQDDGAGNIMDYSFTG